MSNIRITNVETRIVSHQMGAGLRNPLRTWSTKEAVLVFLSTDAGINGVGESWCEGGRPETLVSLIENDVKPLVVGRNPLNVEAIWRSLYDANLLRGTRCIVSAAISGVDIALWDILGKFSKMPVHRLLGTYREEVPAYASGGLYAINAGTNELAEEMTRYVKQGFKGVKLKVGGARLTEDVDRLRAVRQAVGNEVKIMVDAVYSLGVADAMRLCRAIEDCDPYFMEAPLPPDSSDALRRLSRYTTIPLAGNEITCTRYDFAQLISDGALTFIQVDCTVCGGISEARKIAAIASAWMLPVTFHNSSTVVGFAANMHVAASIDNCDSVEMHMIHRMLFEKVAEPIRITSDGSVRAPIGVGLGVAVAAPADQ